MSPAQTCDPCVFPAVKCNLANKHAEAILTVSGAFMFMNDDEEEDEDEEDIGRSRMIDWRWARRDGMQGLNGAGECTKMEMIMSNSFICFDVSLLPCERVLGTSADHCIPILF